MVEAVANLRAVPEFSALKLLLAQLPSVAVSLGQTRTLLQAHHVLKALALQEGKEGGSMEAPVGKYERLHTGR